ncbi:hypothetical protein EB796_006728 [Bugula neritina]|uniref:SULT6B1 n=1 Tax=Bugula neritina TaxID=10212 RepID=A0A7J7KBN6_BUGNE|nr:hypothetical protein EB796_006728 [Bugula neritina]
MDAPLPEKFHHNWLEYSESRDLKDTENLEPCDSLLEKVSDVNQSDYRIQLITASPGSGSDWCYSAMAMLTGHTTDSVYNYLHSKSLAELPHRALYYKTHWPFMRHFGPVDKYLSTHPVRVVLLLRNPYDAGFSEFVRQAVSSKNAYSKKYLNVESIFKESSFLESNSSDRPSRALRNHLTRFFKNWRSHHEYWLKNFTGSLKVVQYSDLVKDVTLFQDIANYFGFDVTSTPTRQRRFQCFLTKSREKEVMRRPRVAVIENSKEKVRNSYKEKISEELEYLESCVESRS